MGINWNSKKKQYIVRRYDEESKKNRFYRKITEKKPGAEKETSRGPRMVFFGDYWPKYDSIEEAVEEFLKFDPSLSKIDIYKWIKEKNQLGFTLYLENRLRKAFFNKYASINKDKDEIIQLFMKDYPEWKVFAQDQEEMEEIIAEWIDLYTENKKKKNGKIEKEGHNIGR